MALNATEYKRRSSLCLFFSFRNLMSRHPDANARLMRWKQCNEDDNWTENAVKTLVKLLMVKKGALEELERVLSSPETPSGCVTIQRSLDGRLQVKLRKAFPHVIYCRVWRWPDLQSHHELQPLPTCKFAFSKKLPEVCINPYHYVRVEANILPPVMVPKFNDTIPSRPLLPFQERAEPTYPPTITCTTTGFTDYESNSFGACSSFLLQPDDPTLLDTLENLPGVSGNPLFNVNEEMDVDAYLTLPESPPPSARPVNYEEQEVWASIAYYEVNKRVGEKFNCKNPTIIVDGYALPDKVGERFSVGRFNNVQRNSSIEKTRWHIGKGIRLEYVNGQVYLECLSGASVFVQSRLMNYANKRCASTVCKVPPEGNMKIFDNVVFSKLLCECVDRSYESVAELTKICTIRISFVKGWGAPYHRVDVTNTPAWIEIHLHGPLIWLDQVLVAMEGPKDKISSVS